MNKKTVFIGAGRMATAFACGMIEKGFQKEKLAAFDISEEASEKFEKSSGIKCASSPEDALQEAEIVFLAVKPQKIECLSEMSSFLKEKLIVSIAAGVKIQKIKDLSGVERIIRVMPNTPVLLGAGASAFSTSDKVNKSDIADTETILESVGTCHRVEEKDLDAVTGLSGSGPAYVFEFISALIEAGIEAGLKKEVASDLAIETVHGAAEMLRHTDKSPEELLEQVVSPGGTTEEGLKVLKVGFRDLIKRAVIKAARRSVELGNM